MRYPEVEKAVAFLVAAADEENRRRFGAAAVTKLTTTDELATAADVEFDEDARRAFAEACADPANSTAGELRAWLDRMDAGTLSDGDMDQPVLHAMMALDHWARYLADQQREFITELAIRTLEQADFQVDADYDDFLAKPEMAAEFTWISTLLRGRA